MSRTATIACLTGAGTAPELMAEAVLALDAVARLHGVELIDQHVPFGGVALARLGHPIPATTRAAVLGAEAVLVAGADEPALADIMAELDLRARVTRVRFGHDDDVALVSPYEESSSEWALDAAFRLAEGRQVRLASVGDESWHDLARDVGAGYEHVRFETLS
ncbi:MAG: hypothetical protein ACYDCH_13485, partial [Gaiellaceae bacterium]